MSDWSEVFSEIEARVLPSWMPLNSSREPDDNASLQGLQLDKLSILSPTKANNLQGIFSFLPSLSFDSLDSEWIEDLEQGNWRSTVSPHELLQYADLLSKRIVKIKSK